MKRINPFAVAALVFAITVMSGGVAGAASYQQIDGTIVDPILCISAFHDGSVCSAGGDVHGYPGVDLAPGVTAISSWLSDAGLPSADLSGAVLTGSVLSFSDLSSSRLVNAVLQDSQSDSVDFVGADLSGAVLDGASLGASVFDFSKLKGTSFLDSELSLASMRYVDLRGADLRSPSLSSLDWTGADLRGANLTGSWIEAPMVDLADFRGAKLANANILAPQGRAIYSLETDFNGALNEFGQPFDPVAAGWTLVPEPSTALLLGLGLTALAVRRGE